MFTEYFEYNLNTLYIKYFYLYIYESMRIQNSYLSYSMLNINTMYNRHRKKKKILDSRFILSFYIIFAYKTA